MQLSGGISAQALLHTITRIVEDNERMHQEVEEKVWTDDLTGFRSDFNFLILSLYVVFCLLVWLFLLCLFVDHSCGQADDPNEWDAV